MHRQHGTRAFFLLPERFCTRDHVLEQCSAVATGPPKWQAQLCLHRDVASFCVVSLVLTRRPASLARLPRRCRSRPMDGVGGARRPRISLRREIREWGRSAHTGACSVISVLPTFRWTRRREVGIPLRPVPGSGRQSGAGWRCCRLLGGASRRARAARGPPERPMLDALKVLFVLTGASTYLGGLHSSLSPPRARRRRPTSEKFSLSVSRTVLQQNVRTRDFFLKVTSD